jgi:hypothetical protein
MSFCSSFHSQGGVQELILAFWEGKRMRVDLFLDFATVLHHLITPDYIKLENGNNVASTCYPTWNIQWHAREEK